MVYIRINASSYSTPISLYVGDLIVGPAGLTIDDSKFYNLSEQTKNQLAELVRQGKIGIAKDSDVLGQTEVSGAEISLLSLLPKMTSAQISVLANPVAGSVVYDTTANKIKFYNNTAWETVTSSV